MNKKNLASKTFVSIALIGAIGYGASSYASDTMTNLTSVDKSATEISSNLDSKDCGMKEFGKGFGTMEHKGNINKGGMMRGMVDKGMKEGRGMMNTPFSNLTEDEKVKLKEMSQTERQAFFKNKIDAVIKLQEDKELVIDKLINGESLTSSEKTILETIKKERAEKKAEKAKRDELKNLMNKEVSSLTDLEKTTLLNNFLKIHKNVNQEKQTFDIENDENK